MKPKISKHETRSRSVRWSETDTMQQLMKSGSSLLTLQLYRDAKNNFKIILFLLGLLLNGKSLIDLFE